MKKIIVAIDGYSACGKSSTAKQVAQKLGYTYIDSGAMYRAATLYFLRNQVEISSEVAVKYKLQKLSVAFDDAVVLLNGEDVSDEIRTKEVNEMVSEVSAISEVRREMVAQQQRFGEDKGVVMDGRDIGTVVFPQAELKVFMTADIDMRVQRRKKELLEKGIEQPFEEIKRNLMERDRIDSTRNDSPLTKADDAIIIDTTQLTLEEQIDQVVAMAKQIIYED